LFSLSQHETQDSRLFFPIVINIQVMYCIYICCA